MKDQEWQYGEGNEYLSLDFSRCQRPDGTYYGTAGMCRKGVVAPPKEKEPAKGRKPVDSATLGKMSDKQLATLMGRKELDTDQKAAIAKELQDRRNAALNADKSGNSARTAAAQEGIDLNNPKGKLDPMLDASDKGAITRDLANGIAPTTTTREFEDPARVDRQWDRDVTGMMKATFGNDPKAAEGAVQRYWNEGETPARLNSSVSRYLSNTYGGTWKGAKLDNAVEAVENSLTLEADRRRREGVDEIILERLAE